MKAWRDAGPEGRTGVCLEILDRLHGRVFELANAVQHTSGQAFVMAFQAGGAHALDRALEAIAYAWVEMTRTPATRPLGEAGQGAADDGEDVHRRPARHRAGDRLQHLPDVELVARPLRLAGDRQPGRREAAPGRGAAAGDHGAGLPGGAGRGRASTRTSSRSPPRSPTDRLAGDARRTPGGEADRLHRRQHLRRLARGARPAGDGLHREGRRQHRRRRLHRQLQGDVPEPRLLVRPLHRPDVHRPAERLPAGGRHRDRRRGRSRRPRSAPGIGAALEQLLGDDARAVELLGGVVNEGVLERLEAAGSRGDVLVASRTVTHPAYADATVRTPTLVGLSAAKDADVYESECFGPVAYLISTRAPTSRSTSSATPSSATAR